MKNTAKMFRIARPSGSGYSMLGQHLQQNELRKMF